MRIVALFVLTAALAPNPALGQAQRSSLRVGHAVDEYFAEFYTSKSRADFVFFKGEPIRFRLSVVNTGDAVNHRDRAEAILKEGRDQLLTKYMPKQQLEQLIRSGAGGTVVIE